MTKLINDTFQDQADKSIGEYSIRNWAYQIVNEKEKMVALNVLPPNCKNMFGKELPVFSRPGHP